MARGIDDTAQRGTLQTETIGVMTGGIDRLFPAENADLFSEVA